MIDSHCHLDHEPLLSDLENIIQRSKDVGIEKLLTISTSIESFSRVKDLVHKDEIIYGTIGIHPHEANKDIVNSLFEANKYFNDQEPWNKKEDQLRLNTIVYTTLEIVRKISFLLYPIIPESTLKALKIFNINENEISLSTVANNDFLVKGNSIKKIDILFNKIEKKND